MDIQTSYTIPDGITAATFALNGVLWNIQNESPVDGAAEFVRACYDRFGQMSVCDNGRNVSWERAVQEELGVEDVFPKKLYTKGMKKTVTDPGQYRTALNKLKAETANWVHFENYWNYVTGALAFGAARVIMFGKPESHLGSKPLRALSEGWERFQRMDFEGAERLTIVRDFRSVKLN